MLINSEEYRAMFEVEEQMWWYKNLHQKVLEEVIHFSGPDRNTKILDAGCGTGGLLLKLKEQRFLNISGFDFNDDAVAFSKGRGLEVQKLDITSINENFPPDSFDIIISNDVLYQFDENTIQITIEHILSLLKPHGIFITNNNAFHIFGGIHDLAVGSQMRFVLADFKKYLMPFPSAKIKKATYWSLFLSPIILVVRLLQKIKMKLNLIDLENIKSDVEMPSKFVNNALFKICRMESKIIKNSPLGSSLFLVISKEK